MKKNKLMYCAALGFLTASLLSSCGGNDKKPSVESVTLDFNHVELVSQADGVGTADYYAFLDAHVSALYGAAETVEWTSTNPDVAVYNETYGAIFGLSKGTTTIRATSTFDSKKFAEVTVDVVDPYVLDLQLSATGLYQVVGSEISGESYVYGMVTTFGNGDDTIVWESSDESVVSVVDGEDGSATLTAVAPGTTTVKAYAGSESTGDAKVREIEVKVVAAGSPETAAGGYSYVGQTATKLDILGKLEAYVVENHLGGITFMGNGGYVMYASNVQKASEEYIPGYGFGILKEGQITADLAGEQNPAWKRYYHQFSTDDPASVNYMNDKGSSVGNIIGYAQDSYFDVQLNEDKTAYEWVGTLSKVDRPIGWDDAKQEWALTPEENQSFSKFRFPVKVGADLKYTTNSKIGKFSAFNNREVALEDYVTPYQIYYTQGFELARSAENLTGSGSIKGSKDYYSASKGGFNAEAWESIGIKAYEEEGESYLEFEFNQPCTPFYAMYYLSSAMYAPVPEEFVKLCGTSGNLDKGAAQLWGTFSSDKTETPLDHSLATGPYALEQWDSDQQIVWKKNPNRSYSKELDAGGTRDLYQIAGIHMNILPGAKSDQELAFNEFLNDKLSACSIPNTKLAEYKGDPRTTQTSSDSNFKLNVNSCDQATWESLFGVNGSITQTSKSNYWAVKPCMSNKNFLDGLSFAINRTEICDKNGVTPAFEYFSDDYMSDPENGVSYNSTKQHADAVKSMIEGTEKDLDGHETGYSLEKAKASFTAACEELIADGSYSDGDTIKFEIAWMYQTDIEDYGNDLVGYFKEAFDNCEGAQTHNLKLEVTQWAAAEWSDVYYKKMMIGQFDLGFGSISGNSYDPLNFLEVLKSDNSSGFTLNWGLDTSAVDGSLVFGSGDQGADEVWSFDALWEAADRGAYVEQGVTAPLVTVLDYSNPVRNADGSLTIEITAQEISVSEDIYGELDSVCLFGTNDANYATYGELYLDRYVYDYTVYNPIAEITDETTFLAAYEEYNGEIFVSDGKGGYEYASEEFAEGTTYYAGDPESITLVESPSWVGSVVDADNGINKYEITFPADMVAYFLSVYENALLVGIDAYSYQLIKGIEGSNFLDTVWQAYSFPAIPQP